MELELLLILSAGIALLAVIGSFILVRRRLQGQGFQVDAYTRLGPAGWDFSSSWASNITGVVVLTTLLGAENILPESAFSSASKNDFAILSLFFAILIPFAPLIYNAIRRPQKTMSGDGTISYQNQGFVWSFVLATLLTIWAVTGELLATAMLIANISTLPPLVLLVMLLSLAIGGLFLLVYIYQSMYAMILQSVDTRTLKTNRDTNIRLFGGAIGDELEREKEALEPPLPNWSVL